MGHQTSKTYVSANNAKANVNYAVLMKHLVGLSLHVFPVTK